SFLSHGAFTIFLGLLWLEAESQKAFWQAIETGASSFANTYNLRQQNDLSDYMRQVEFEAFFIAEGSKIGGDEKIEAFLANEAQYQTYQALFGGLCFSLAALYKWYGPEWEKWVFQKINLDYRLARFGLEAWAKWLNIPYVEPPPDQNLIHLFKADNELQ
nr:hypothetical protein [Phycisphaerae bacterium]NIX29094.1 hypothetical protein [Phycisphaerae bacterium]